MYRGVKRALDFITALLALIVLSPLLAITALAVKLDSNGPAIFKQQRLGLHGKTFWIYKFRSMATASRVSLSFRTTAPPTTSEWPPMYLVVE